MIGCMLVQGMEVIYRELKKMVLYGALVAILPDNWATVLLLIEAVLLKAG